MNFFEFLFVPTILFMVIVAPVWIGLHYKSVNRSSRSLNAEDRENVEHILQTVDKLTERIATLEALLDAEHDDWRENSDSVDEHSATQSPRERSKS